MASPRPSMPKILSLGEYKVAVNEIPGPTIDNVTAFDNLQVQLGDADVLFLRRGDQYKSPRLRVSGHPIFVKGFVQNVPNDILHPTRIFIASLM